MKKLIQLVFAVFTAALFSSCAQSGYGGYGGYGGYSPYGAGAVGAAQANLHIASTNNAYASRAYRANPWDPNAQQNLRMAAAERQRAAAILRQTGRSQRYYEGFINRTLGPAQFWFPPGTFVP